jgi:tight adherence protein B
LSFEKFAALLAAGVSQQQAIEMSGVKNQSHFSTLRLSIDAGSPAIDAARVLARVQTIENETRDEIEQAQQVPISTKKLMLWLPWFGLMLAELTGLGVFQALLSPVGLLLLGIAAGLSYLGHRISERMIKAATEMSKPPQQPMLKLAIFVQTGIQLGEALRLCDISKQSELIQFALQSGANLKLLLQSQIESDLAAWRNRSLVAAKRLSVRLMLPLGLTTLPAFLLLTVAPILLGVLTKGET